MCKHTYKCFFYTLALSLRFLIFTHNYYCILVMFMCLLFYRIYLVATNSFLNTVHCAAICMKLFYLAIIATAYSISLLHLYEVLYCDFEKTAEKYKIKNNTSLVPRVCSVPNTRNFNNYPSV